MSSSAAFGQVSTTDLFENATVFANSPTRNNGGGAANNPDSPASIFTSNPSDGNINPTNTLFSDSGPPVFGSADGSPTAGVDFIEFTPAGGSVTISGVRLFTQDDTANGDDGQRGTSSFSFFADLTGDGDFTDVGERLVNEVNPFDETTANNLYTFSSITAMKFRAEFVRSDTSVGGSGGPRITELDAVVPEPATLGLIVLAGMGLAARRRRA